MSEPKKIVLFGPESTGKTELAQQLALHTGHLWAPEFARIFLENKRMLFKDETISSNEICVEADIFPIAMGQIALEDTLSNQTKGYIFCDTNPLQTWVYVKYYYQKEYPWLTQLVKSRNYDFYLLTYIDVEWMPDPLRDRPNNRAYMFEIFETTLKKFGCKYATVRETGMNRVANALQCLRNFEASVP